MNATDKMNDQVFFQVDSFEKTVTFLSENAILCRATKHDGNIPGPGVAGDFGPRAENPAGRGSKAHN